jgi:hypothetical protein
MSKEDFVSYDFDTERFELYHLTVDRMVLNEMMNTLAINNHVNVTVDEMGHIGFDIPSESKVNVRSINIIQEMNNMLVVLDFKMSDPEISNEEMKILEHKKTSILSAIEIVSDIIIDEDIGKGDNDVEQEKQNN